MKKMLRKAANQICCHHINNIIINNDYYYHVFFLVLYARRWWFTNGNGRQMFPLISLSASLISYSAYKIILDMRYARLLNFVRKSYAIKMCMAAVGKRRITISTDYRHSHLVIPFFSYMYVSVIFCIFIAIYLDRSTHWCIIAMWKGIRWCLSVAPTNVWVLSPPFPGGQNLKIGQASCDFIYKHICRQYEFAWAERKFAHEI